MRIDWNGHTFPFRKPQLVGDMSAILKCRSDAEALAGGGCDAILIENMADLPY